MKKLLIYMFVLLIVTGCKSKEEKAEEIIKEYLNSTFPEIIIKEDLDFRIEKSYLSMYNDDEALEQIKKAIPLQREIDEIEQEIINCVEANGIHLMSFEKEHLDSSYLWIDEIKNKKAVKKIEELSDRLREIKGEFQKSTTLLSFYPLLESKELGWDVYYKFSYIDEKGYLKYASLYFILSKNLKEIIDIHDLQDPKYIEISNYIRKNYKFPIKGGGGEF